MNVLRADTVFDPDPRVFQEELNQKLEQLGDRVHNVQPVKALNSDFAVLVTYWEPKANILAEMTAAAELLPDNTDPEDSIFVIALYDSQRHLIKRAISNLIGSIIDNSNFMDPDDLTLINDLSKLKDRFVKQQTEMPENVDFSEDTRVGPP